MPTTYCSVLSSLAIVYTVIKRFSVDNLPRLLKYGSLLKTGGLYHKVILTSNFIFITQ